MVRWPGGFFGLFFAILHRAIRCHRIVVAALVALVGFLFATPEIVLAAAGKAVNRRRPRTSTQRVVRRTPGTSKLVKITPSRMPATVPMVTRRDYPRQDLQISIQEFPHWEPGYALFVLPGQSITIDTRVAGGRAYRWSGQGRFVLPAGARVKADAAGRGPVLPAGSLVVWQAPYESGPARLTLKTAATDGWKEEFTLGVQVMVPANDLVAGAIRGYRIGRYPSRASFDPDRQADYSAPPGFLKLPDNGSMVPVSPRFYLNDFACKQRSAGERYVALRPELLRFLEAITDKVESEGFRCTASYDTLTTPFRKASFGRPVVIPRPGAVAGRPILVMSGYRTPAYNRSLGNVRLSRHQYGDAADIIVDTDADGVMDDLNHDGRLDGNDARTLAGWIEDLWQTPEFVSRPGGLGIYNAEGDHGPFVHVDVRGERARWGGNGLDWNEESEADLPRAIAR